MVIQTLVKTFYSKNDNILVWLEEMLRDHQSPNRTMNAIHPIIVEIFQSGHHQSCANSMTKRITHIFIEALLKRSFTIVVEGTSQSWDSKWGQQYASKHPLYLDQE